MERTNRPVALALAALACALLLALAPVSAWAETTMDLDTFITELAENDYVIDGDDYDGGLTVTVTPESGCFQYTTNDDGTITCRGYGCNDSTSGAAHTCSACSESEGTCYGAATENTPERVNSGLLQFQLLSSTTDAVSISNVDFEYVAAAFTICANSSWAEAITYDEESSTYQGERSGEIYAALLYFLNDTDLTISGCTFDGVVLTHFGSSSSAEFDTTVTDCDFSNIYNAYAIKDIRGQNITVTGCTFTDCGAGIMVSALSSSYSVSSVTISDNTFTNVDTEDTAAEGKAGSRGLIQIASSGDYSSATIVLDGNVATGSGPVLRQLNSSFSLSSATGDITGLLDEDGDLTATSDTLSSLTTTKDDDSTAYIIATTVTDDDGNVTTVFTYYTVTYQESEDSTEVYETRQYLAGTTATLLSASDVAKDGCVLTSWTDGTTTYAAGASYMVSADATLYAVWCDHEGYTTTTVTTAATCTEVGEALATCSNCGATWTEALAATGHTAGEAVIENEVAATCTEDGSYDEVVYCTVCGAELSRETMAVAAAHTWDDGVAVWADDYSSVTVTWTCKVCGETYSETSTEIYSYTDDDGNTVYWTILEGPVSTEGGWYFEEEAVADDATSDSSDDESELASTGDSTALVTGSIAGMGALALAAGLASRRRRNAV